MRRIGLVSVLHFLWPLLLLYVVLKVFIWKVLTMFQPDLIYWLEIVAAIVFLKGLLEILLTWRVFSQKSEPVVKRSK